MSQRSKIPGRTYLMIFAFMVAFIGLIFVADSLSQSEQVQTVVAEFGYVGVVVIAIIAGLNVVVPVPAATFTPIFLAAGLTTPLIVLALAIGTMIADFTGFFFGHLSRKVVSEKYPKIFDFFLDLKERRSGLLFPVVTLYAAFVPFPNEAILIPLALAGVRFQKLIIPLFIGNIIYHLSLVYGVAALVQYFA